VNPWLAKNLVYRPATWLRGEPVHSLLRQYEESQWWSPEEVARAQEKKLREIMRYASKRSPYYREQVARLGLVAERLDASDLQHFPVLTKTDLVERANDLYVKGLPGTYSWKTTGGSTGVPVRLRKSRFATAAEQAASWRSYRWYGVGPGDRQARFWGTPLTGQARMRARLIDWVMNRDRFSAFAFTRDELRGYYERLATARPAWVYGYVSLLVEFSNFCIEEGLPLAEIGVRAVVTTSEALGPQDRKRISHAFGARTFNEYGCGEVGAVLYECEAGCLHLMAENLFVELVSAPTEDKPDAHRLLITDLHNRATPLIRYDVADRVVPAPSCPCGRGLPAFREVFGRAYDFVECADGTRYHGEFFMYHLEQARNEGSPILQAQFVQDPMNCITLRIVAGPGYRPEHGRAVADNLSRASQGRFEVGVECVEAIARDRSGKIRLIVAFENETSSS
jgi:phenylacetate-CoA ligase